VPRPFAEAAVLLSARRLDIRTASHCDRFGSRRCRAASDQALAGAGVIASLYWRDWRLVALALAGAVCSIIPRSPVRRYSTDC